MTGSGSDAAMRDLALEQLEWHWGSHVRPRLDGLTDDEYTWEPVDGCWNVRLRDDARTSIVGGGGPYIPPSSPGTASMRRSGRALATRPSRLDSWRSSATNGGSVATLDERSDAR